MSFFLTARKVGSISASLTFVRDTVTDRFQTPTKCARKWHFLALPVLLIIATTWFFWRFGRFCWDKTGRLPPVYWGLGSGFDEIVKTVSKQVTPFSTSFHEKCASRIIRAQIISRRASRTEK